MNRANIAQRPNIVLIMADDLGFCDLGCYGGEIRTPNLDQLAQNGVRFTHFYNNAVCVATRASLLTGLYSHQVGKKLGGNLQAGRNNVTFAEVLRTAGYRTLMVGKWHNGYGNGEKPVDRGFDRYWGLLSGCSNYFNPGHRRCDEPEPVHKSPNDIRPWGNDDQVMMPYTPENPDFYSTDAFTQHALNFLEQYGRENRPFLLYVAHTAPHFPMHAWPQDIARYQGNYIIGWDELREQRYQRLVNMELIDAKWGKSGRDDASPEWKEVVDKEPWDRKMAVYAAMVDRMDQGIGRILEKIRELRQESNTLVLFLSDNGGCGENIDNTPDRVPGGVDTYTTVDAPWANASNTPFRKYKAFDHEGGISTPLIACWPNMIEPGSITHQVGHVIDFLPTFAELGEAEYPLHFNGHDILPMEGKSLASILRGEERQGHDSLFWELAQCRAVRKGIWKAVSMGPKRKGYGGHYIPAGHENWELYNMEADRCELNDLSSANPEIVRELDGMWHRWFERCQRDKAEQ